MVGIDIHGGLYAEGMRAAACLALSAGLAFGQKPDPQQLFRKGVEAQQSGNYALAVRDYEQLLRVQPESPDLLANLGAALVHLNRFDEAIADYQAALKLDPKNALIRMNLGLAFFKKGDLQSAAGEFERLHAANPSDVRVATLLGNCYVRLGRQSQAAAVLTPIQEAHPDDLDLAYVLGSALLETGQVSKGAALLEMVGKRGQSADAYLMAGSAFMKRSDYPRALPDLEAALSLNSNLPDIYTLVGVAEEQTGNADAAEKHLRKALDLKSDDFQANLHLGGLLYEKRDLDSARIYIDKALKIDPSSTFGLYERALLNSKSGNAAAAATDLEKVVQADPNWLQAHVELAAVYYKLHRPADGLKQREIVDRLAAEQQLRGPGQAQQR